MPTTETNLAERSGALVESHKGYDPRLVSFYFVLAAMFVTLVSGLAYQQLSKVEDYSERERVQNQRRILIPGPRGDILDRHGVQLVTNKSRWTVGLHLDELQSEVARERKRIGANFLAANAGNKKEVPSNSELTELARLSIAQRYLDQINRLLTQNYRVDASALKNHFQRDLMLPFTLVDGLDDVSYARLIENLPVNSPVDVYAVPVRHYPYNSAAAHTLGYVRSQAVEAEGFPGEDLRTFRGEGTRGRAGVEFTFDQHLQGVAGMSIYRVDPSGYRTSEPLEHRKPVRGKDLVTSLDIDLQLAAEEAIGDRVGTAVALDIATGEVLMLASKPDYDLNLWYPRLAPEVYRDIQARGAENNLAVNGFYPPGSTFKIVTAIAALRAGAITPESHVECHGTMRIGNRTFVCKNHADQGDVTFPMAIAKSCNLFFYQAALAIGPDALALEARRFHLDKPTGIELPYESNRMLIPDPEWQKRTGRGGWFDGNTANMGIGQDAVQLSALQMGCFIASVARGETVTRPSIVHQPDRARQKTASIGLTPEQHAALFAGFENCTTIGSGKLFNTPAYRVPGVQVGGKTGTAQKIVTMDGKTGVINYAWFVGFAPLEKPEIAIAIMLQGDTVGEDYGGGHNAVPVASVVLKKYFENKTRPAGAIVSPFRTK